MMKELILAIFLGAILGFGATGSYLAISKNKNPASRLQPTPTLIIVNNSHQADNSPTPQESDSLNTADSGSLSISSPENEALVSTSKIDLKGSTGPGSFVIIKTPLKIYSLTAADNGSFSQTIDLETGVNFIQISSLDSADNQSDTQIIITYSTAKL